MSIPNNSVKGNFAATQALRLENALLESQDINANRAILSNPKVAVAKVIIYLVINAVLIYVVYRVLGMSVFWSAVLTTILFGLIAMVVINIWNFVIGRFSRKKLIAESLMAEKKHTSKPKDDNPWDL